jgi:hypothetical protein
LVPSHVQGASSVAEVVDQHPASAPAQPSCKERVEKVLAEAGELLSQKKIRDRVRMRAADVHSALAALVADGSVMKSADGYQLAS